MAVVSPNSVITYSAILATGSTAKNLQTGTTSAPTASTAASSGRTLWIRAPKANTAAVFIGDSTVTSVPGGNVLTDLQPGEGLFIDFSNLGTFWAVSAAAQSLFSAVLE